jgi:catechol 2,3-dioxygenase
VKKKKTVKRAKATKGTKATKRTTAGKSAKVIKIPVFHHALLKTSRMQEMIDWYAAVVGIEPVFQAPGIAFLSNDGANHRISLAGGPHFRDNPQFRTFAGMHHLAFEYASVDDLLDSWRRLRDEYGYEPHVAVHHGMTLSFYYVDPDGNSVELQADVFGDWKKSKRWMHTSPQFRGDPIGKFVVPAKMVAARSAGVKQKELLRRAYAGEYAPSAPYDFRVDF